MAFSIGKRFRPATRLAVTAIGLGHARVAERPQKKMGQACQDLTH